MDRGKSTMQTVGKTRIEALFRPLAVSFRLYPRPYLG